MYTKNILAIIASLTLLLFFGCKDKNDDVIPSDDSLPEEVTNILPQAILDDVKQKGMLVHGGSNPPYIEGFYVMDPMELLSRYSEEDSRYVGQVINAYFFKFYDQNMENNTVMVDYTNKVGDLGTGIGAFISGSSNKFTIFIESTGNDGGTDYKNIGILSGELNSNKEIKHLQYAIYLKEKNEKPGTTRLIPVNTGRIWIDGDTITKRTPTYAPNTWSLLPFQHDASAISIGHIE